MPRFDPLPFRLRIPGRDTIDDRGARSVSYRVEGFLHLGDGVLTLEWTGTQRTQHASLTEIRDEVDALPVEFVDIPMRWLTEVRLRRSWRGPAVELRARRLDAFDGVPAARPGSLLLHIRRRDRALAAELVAAIARVLGDAALPSDDRQPELPPGEAALPESEA